MRTVKFVIAFQGTHYTGWQNQKNGNTLQEIFERHLLRVLNEKVILHGCSRTDSGVHARAMVAHFHTKSKLSDKKIKDALNYYLPEDVVVLSSKTTPNGFHARFAAKGKTYEYRLWNSRTKPAFYDAPFVLWCPFKLDVKRMQHAAKHLLGKHDFSAFQDSGEDERNPVKKIQKVQIVQKGSDIRLRFSADGFLRHMIRVMVGTLLDVGRGRVKPEQIKEVLASKDRKKAGPTSKAQGLTLIKVTY